MAELKQVGQPIKVSKLYFDNIIGAGCQIRAHIDQEVPCVEFTMKGNCKQVVMQQCVEPILTASEPFIQFEPDSWKEMISTLFQQIVDAWNKKYVDSDPDHYRIIEICEERNEFLTLEDGFVYYYPDNNNSGAISADNLRIIADELDKRNKVHNENIEEYFKNCKNKEEEIE